MTVGDDPPVFITVVLRHDQTIDLEQRNAILTRKNWWETFPPDGCEVVSWHFLMGLGHLILLSVPHDLISDLNVEIQRSCWGSYSSEVFVTYNSRRNREVPVPEAVSARKNSPPSSKKVSSDG